MPGATRIEIKGDEAIVRGLNKMASSVMVELIQSMEDAAKETEQEMKSNIPNRSGSLERSIGYDIDTSNGSVVAHIGPDDSQFEGRTVGRATELGRQSGGGFPNWNDIANRYGVSLGVAYAIAKKIHREGSRGLFYAEKSLASLQGRFLQHGIQAVRAIAGKF